MWRRHQRKWFQDKDGTYFRNCPLILGEQTEALRRGRLRRAKKLAAEWSEAWREGVIRTDTLGRGDVVVQMGRFRDVYPDKPGLWCLDDAG